GAPQAREEGRPRTLRVSRDLYRPAVLRWRIPFLNERSMTETVLISSLAAPSASPAFTRERSFLICVRRVPLRALLISRRRSLLRMFLIALFVLANVRSP